MNYTISEIEDKNVWEKFIDEAKPHTFLQSWDWGESYKNQGQNIFRLGVFQNESLEVAAQAIKFKAKRGTYLLLPHGPVFKNEKDMKKLFPKIETKISEIAQSEKCDFIRVCPTFANNEENELMFKKLGFRPSPIHTHPELAWILDIQKSEDEILAGMRKTTRYMIKKAIKEGAVVRRSSDPKDMEKFWPIYAETAERQKFTPFSEKSLRAEFEIFSKDKKIDFYFGEFQGETIVAAMIVYDNESAFYHNSGSLKKFEKVGISYLVQWEVINHAKELGLKYYNFWGIAPEDKPKHPWAGLSLFKKGFGGFAEPYIHSQDKPLTKKYYLNLLIEKARSIKRGYH